MSRNKALLKKMPRLIAVFGSIVLAGILLIIVSLAAEPEGVPAHVTSEEIRRLGIVVPGPSGPTGCGWYDDDTTGIARLSPPPSNCNPRH